jgi:heme/copper-type cytochrome/quinol oxidase subunit 2
MPDSSRAAERQLYGKEEGKMATRSPVLPDGAAPAGGAGGYRDQSAIVTALSLLFLLGACLAALGALAVLIGLKMGLMHGFLVSAVDPRALVLGVVILLSMVMQIGAFLVTGILFLVWIYRANKNARMLGAQGMTFTPGSCVWWFFIPLLNFVKPFRAMVEIYVASDPDARYDGRMDTKEPLILPFWWVSVIVSSLLGQIGNYTVGSSSAVESAHAPWLYVASALFGIAAAVLSMVIVRTIHERQREKAARSRRADPGGRPVAGDVAP